MGHYYSISSRLKVKADAPKELFAILDVLYEPIEGKRLKNDGLGYEELVIGFGNNACYMPFAPWTKEKTDYGWLYSHTGSSKHDWIDEIVALFRKYQEWFIFDKYDIAFRAVYESATRETAIYFNGTTFLAGTGYAFERVYNEIGIRQNVAHLHPYHADDDRGNFDEHGYETLPWNYKEVLKLNAPKGKKPMGTYVGIATRLKIKKTADAGSLEFLQAVYGDREDDFGQDRQGQIQPLLNALLGRSGISYFPGWIWSYAKDCGDYFLLESRASTKENNIPHNFMMLLQDQRDDFILEKGDIILRQASEEHSIEKIVYFDGEKLVVGDGYAHGYGDLSPIASPSHPRNTIEDHCADPEEEAAKEAAAIPWNYEQIQKLNEESYAEYLEELRLNSFGGGGR